MQKKEHLIAKTANSVLILIWSMH